MRLNFFGIAILATCFLAALADEVEETKELGADRDGKVLSLFSIVTFKNTGCRSTSTYGSSARNGTCYTASECSSKGGNSFGTCAAGFGVCCVFLYTATGDVTQNCSYIQNPGFPSAYSGTSTVTYTIRKCRSDVCAVRLDFDSFTTLGPAVTTEVNGGVCQDSFTVTTTSGAAVPSICGLNSGQHIYAELGEADAATATLTFAFGAVASTNRIWQVKVTQIECWNRSRPPNGCLQYHSDLTGRFTTFNFLSTTNSHTANQFYSICIRQELGYCCIQYSVCQDASSYTLSTNTGAIKAMLDTDCILDYVAIPGSSANCNTGNAANLHTKYCGNVFNTDTTANAVNIPICDCTKPFEVIIRTDNAVDVAQAFSRGTCLEYKQLPC